MNIAREFQVSARRRVTVCLALGAVGGAVVALLGPWQLALVSGWNVMAAALLAWTWIEIWSADAATTKRWAEPEDNSHLTALVVMTAVSIVSLAGMVFGLAKARHVDQPMAAVLIVSSIVNVVLAWSVVHTMYALHYAHLYYRAPVGGIDFHCDEAPDYHDFAYMAFTVGMSFAVSDTDLQGAKFRRTVTGHALVSYLFGAVIVGMTINVMAGLV